MKQKIKYTPQKEKILSRPNKKWGYVRDLGTSTYVSVEQKRREFGAHFTSVDIFKKFIFPEIKDVLYNYTWIDLFAGEGNLILPILEAIPANKRIDFFKEHIFLYDIQKEMVEKSIENAKNYGIPSKIAKNNIQLRDTIQNYPDLKQFKYPPYHITNPPYLYLGYIAKNSERNLKYFFGPNEGYQDLYQIALINDLRHDLEKLIYIIPTNFLFGFSVSNKIRKDFSLFIASKKQLFLKRKSLSLRGLMFVYVFLKKNRNYRVNQSILRL